MKYKCISCGNSKNYQAHTVKEMMYGLNEKFTYFECLNCGCLQIETIPVSLEKYYPNNYYSFNIPIKLNPMDWILSFLGRERNRYCLFNQGLLGRVINRKSSNPEADLFRKWGLKKGWKILDIGCGSGLWLSSYKDLGLNLYGIDPYIETGVNNGSIKIIKGTIYDLPQSDKFQLIRCNHSFEHTSDQYETLKTIFNLLTLDGICFIAMPVKTETIWNRYGVNWVQIDAPRHLAIHTVKSFTIMAKKAGFEISDIIFNSTEFQFWGSEQYVNGIPLTSKKSYNISPNLSIFSKEDILRYKNEAEQLNHQSQGDSAIFILKPLKDNYDTTSKTVTTPE
jgi:2-polyprenyl-3-methyl-5-hydroxy-6-metoxy-1,4-benzoquinol methylase